jgi:hypothetical protein
VAFFFLLGLSLVVMDGAEVEAGGTRVLLVVGIDGSSSSLSRISMISGIGLIGRAGPSMMIKSGDTERMAEAGLAAASLCFFFFLLLASSEMRDVDGSTVLSATG